MAIWVDFIFLSLFYDHPFVTEEGGNFNRFVCLLYTSDAADDVSWV